LTDRTNVEAAEMLFAAWARWDLATVESLLSDDAVDRRPQSGEEFAGRTNIMAMYQVVPGPPDITWRRIRGGPSVWVAQGLVEYGEGPVHIIGVVEFADGNAIESDFYFADPFEPPEYRAPWAST
jgi:SnoaL-like domain